MFIDGKLKLIKSNKKGRAQLLPLTNNSNDLLLFDKVRTYFSRPNPAARFCPGVDPISCPISINGSIRIGFIPNALQYINELNCEIIIDEELEALYQPGPLYPKGTIPLIPNEKYTYRVYQQEAIDLALQNGRGIILIPTGGGKSLIGFGLAFGLYDLLPNNASILLIVPTLSLVEQFYKDFLDYGADPNIVFKFSEKNKKNKPSTKQIIITNRDWLNGHKEELPKNIFAVIADECHSTANNKTSSGKFIESLNTCFKYGMTATLELKNEIDKFNIIGLLGPILINKDVTELQNEGFIANLDIFPIKFNYEGFKEPKYDCFEDICNAYRAETERIESNVKGVIPICKLAESLANSGLNVLILFDHTIYGKSIYENLNTENKSFIDGSIDVNIRENIRENTELTKGSIIVGQSKCLSTGVNIKNLHAAILTLQGTASTKFLQSIGRYLRPHPSKSKAYIFDIFHNMKYSKKHFYERLKLYSNYYKIEIPSPKIINIK